MITLKESLYKQYKDMNDEQLEKIISNSTDESEREVAHDILNSRYNQRLNKVNEAAQKQDMYSAINQIARDIRFMKNCVIVGIIIGVAALLSIIITFR